MTSNRQVLLNTRPQGKLYTNILRPKVKSSFRIQEENNTEKASAESDEKLKETTEKTKSDELDESRKELEISSNRNRQVIFNTRPQGKLYTNLIRPQSTSSSRILIEKNAPSEPDENVMQPIDQVNSDEPSETPEESTEISSNRNPHSHVLLNTRPQGKLYTNILRPAKLTSSPRIVKENTENAPSEENTTQLTHQEEITTVTEMVSTTIRNKFYLQSSRRGTIAHKKPAKAGKETVTIRPTMLRSNNAHFQRPNPSRILPQHKAVVTTEPTEYFLEEIIPADVPENCQEEIKSVDDLTGLTEEIPEINSEDEGVHILDEQAEFQPTEIIPIIEVIDSSEGTTYFLDEVHWKLDEDLPTGMASEDVGQSTIEENNSINTPAPTFAPVPVTVTNVQEELEHLADETSWDDDLLLIDTPFEETPVEVDYDNAKFIRQISAGESSVSHNSFALTLISVSIFTVAFNMIFSY